MAFGGGGSFGGGGFGGGRFGSRGGSSGGGAPFLTPAERDRYLQQLRAKQLAAQPKESKSFLSGLISKTDFVTNAVEQVAKGLIYSVPGTYYLGRNFGKDVADTIVPGGPLPHRTVDMFKAMGGQTKQDFTKPRENFGYLLLDLYTAATLGAGGAARAGAAAGKLRELRGPLPPEEPLRPGPPDTGPHPPPLTPAEDAQRVAEQFRRPQGEMFGGHALDKQGDLFGQDLFANPPQKRLFDPTEFDANAKHMAQLDASRRALAQADQEAIQAGRPSLTPGQMHMGEITRPVKPSPVRKLWDEIAAKYPDKGLPPWLRTDPRFIAGSEGTTDLGPGGLLAQGPQPSLPGLGLDDRGMPYGVNPLPEYRPTPRAAGTSRPQYPQLQLGEVTRPPPRFIADAEGLSDLGPQQPRPWMVELPPPEFPAGLKQVTPESMAEKTMLPIEEVKARLAAAAAVSEQFRRGRGPVLDPTKPSTELVPRDPNAPVPQPETLPKTIFDPNAPTRPGLQPVEITTKNPQRYKLQTNPDILDKRIALANQVAAIDRQIKAVEGKAKVAETNALPHKVEELLAKRDKLRAERQKRVHAKDNLSAPHQVYDTETGKFIAEYKMHDSAMKKVAEMNRDSDLDRQIREFDENAPTPEDIAAGELSDTAMQRLRDSYTRKSELNKALREQAKPPPVAPEAAPVEAAAPAKEPAKKEYPPDIPFKPLVETKPTQTSMDQLLQHMKGSPLLAKEHPEIAARYDRAADLSPPGFTLEYVHGFDGEFFAEYKAKNGVRKRIDLKTEKPIPRVLTPDETAPLSHETETRPVENLPEPKTEQQAADIARVKLLEEENAALKAQLEESKKPKPAPTGTTVKPKEKTGQTKAPEPTPGFKEVTNSEGKTLRIPAVGASVAELTRSLSFAKREFPEEVAGLEAAIEEARKVEGKFEVSGRGKSAILTEGLSDRQLGVNKRKLVELGMSEPDAARIGPGLGADLRAMYRKADEEGREVTNKDVVTALLKHVDKKTAGQMVERIMKLQGGEEMSGGRVAREVAKAFLKTPPPKVKTVEFLYHHKTGEVLTMDQALKRWNDDHPLAPITTFKRSQLASAKLTPSKAVIPLSRNRIVAEWQQRVQIPTLISGKGGPLARVVTGRKTFESKIKFEMQEIERLVSDSEHMGMMPPEPKPGQTETAYKKDVGDWIDTANQLAKINVLFLKPGYFLPNLLGQVWLTLADHAWNPYNIARTAKIQNELYFDKDLAGVRAQKIRSLVGLGAVRAVYHERGLSKSVNYVYDKMASGYGKILDTPFRENAFLNEAIRHGYDTTPKIQKLVDSIPQIKEAESMHDYTQRLINTNPDLISIGRRANRNMIDYARLGVNERKVIRRIVFFYPWVKGASIYGAHFAAEHPVQLAANAALGQYAQQKAEKELGPLPGFMQGVFKVGERNVPGLGKMPKIINPTSLTILGQPGEILLSGRHALTGGSESLSDYLNPVVTTGLAAAMRVDPQTGAQYPSNMSVLDIIGSQIEKIPAPLRLKGKLHQADQFKSGEKNPADVLLPETKGEALGRFTAGAYPYTLNTKEARSRAFAERKALSDRRERVKLTFDDARTTYKKELQRVGVLSKGANLPQPLVTALGVRQQLNQEMAVAESMNSNMTQLNRFEVELGVMIRRKLISETQAKQLLTSLASAPEATIRHVRRQYRASYFGGDVLSAYGASARSRGAVLPKL